MILIISLWGGLVFRLYVLQVKNAPMLAEKAEKQHEGILKVEPRRGRIIDRNNNILAVSVKVKSVFCVPYEIENEWKTGKVLSEILGLPKGEIMEKLERKAKFCWIKRKISDEETAGISEAKLPGIYMLDEVKRFYPKGSLLSHVIGFVNIDNEGMEGIERSQNGYLKGKAGLARITHDAKGRELLAHRDFIDMPEDGADIVLTIDEVIQNIVEEELEKLFKQFTPKSVSAVVQDVKTGDILAIANCPTFDLNKVGQATPASRKNYALINAYEPGSLFKVITASVALNEKVVDMDEVIYCEQGAYYIGGHTLHDAHPYDSLTFTDVIAKSSNIGTAKVATRLEPDVFYNYITEFGFGKPVGLPLEGEARGRLANYKRWSGTSQFSIAMGHEIMVTVFQMANAISTVANGGRKVNAKLLDRLMDAQGNLLQKFDVSPGDSIIRKDSVQKLLGALIKAVSKEGTAPKAAVEGYTVAGKTGTAQKIINGIYSHSKYISSFYGFLPAEDPKVSITIMVDEPGGSIKGYGGDVAGPSFSTIGSRVMDYLLPKTPSQGAEGVIVKPANPVMGPQPAMPKAGEA